jgi:hypothetical protein
VAALGAWPAGFVFSGFVNKHTQLRSYKTF